jgi:hypothetical protein
MLNLCVSWIQGKITWQVVIKENKESDQCKQRTHFLYVFIFVAYIE